LIFNYLKFIFARCRSILLYLFEFFWNKKIYFSFFPRNCIIFLYSLIQSLLTKFEFFLVLSSFLAFFKTSSTITMVCIYPFFFFILDKVSIFKELSSFWPNKVFKYQFRLCFDLNFILFEINELLDKIKDWRVLEGHTHKSLKHKTFCSRITMVCIFLFFLLWSKFWYLLNYRLFSSFSSNIFMFIFNFGFV